MNVRAAMRSEGCIEENRSPAAVGRREAAGEDPTEWITSPGFAGEMKKKTSDRSSTLFAFTFCFADSKLANEFNLVGHKNIHVASPPH
jgi:hypothetical protein